MTATTVRANAQALSEATEWQRAHSELEEPIYDIAHLLRAAGHLQDDGDEDLRSSARLIVDLACRQGR
jgi:DnaJ-domain-containing protein 1